MVGESRDENGMHIAASKGWKTPLQVLDFVGAECDRRDRRVVHADGRWLRKNPTLPDKYHTVSDGLT